MYADNDRFVADCEACAAAGLESPARFLGNGRWLCDPCSADFIRGRVADREAKSVMVQG